MFLFVLFGLVLICRLRYERCWFDFAYAPLFVFNLNAQIAPRSYHTTYTFFVKRQYLFHNNECQDTVFSNKNVASFKYRSHKMAARWNYFCAKSCFSRLFWRGLTGDKTTCEQNVRMEKKFRLEILWATFSFIQVVCRVVRIFIGILNGWHSALNRCFVCCVPKTCRW